MNKKLTRRDFLTYTGYGLIAVSAPSLVSKAAVAAEGEKIKLDDPIASALGYVQVTPNSEQNCDNCMHAKGDVGADWRPCALFQNKLVEKNAWCKGWVAAG
ncbi:high-potential iron-sulfur protein [Echinimonas agarilytica]|uniref:High-potential iron-sulfur protein n=1 Tax=Echinimonas agarilytica TaxID=1215918 RepID=A0AA41W535_9GAMM|nr:high-potential iron-sulfur protein [Echinimonas agarilytica]MCM2679051.1 high-potential iron-sulfur protein [Echinimonas agarilytica]